MSDKSRSSWPLYSVLVALFLAATLGLFQETAWSIVSIWDRSQTYTHGYLILPIAAWLVWERRHELAQLSPRPAFLPLLPIVLLGLIWLSASLVGVLVVQQFALIAIILCGIWLILGNQVSWAMAFPLAYLLFLVPVGEDFVPPMMEYTASFTVWMVRASGIPVYREGMYFFLPTGSWSVVEACSGVRYLIASVTLGSLFAYITYSSVKKRLLFILASIIVPIIANGLRAYMIVMIGHLSNMELAVGVDHLIYGWVFFGVVMLILFSVGSRWRDPDVTIKRHPAVAEASGSEPTLVPVLRAVIALAVAIAVSGIWPLYARHLDNTQGDTEVVVIPRLPAFNNWQPLEASFWEWRPVNRNPDHELLQLFSSDDGKVALYAALYLTQEQGGEAVTSANLIISSEESRWRIVAENTTDVELRRHGIRVPETLIRSHNEELLAWSWYRVGDGYTSSTYQGKLMELWSRLIEGRRDAARIVVATPTQRNLPEARQRLQSFLDASLAELESQLDIAAGVK